MPTKKSGFTIIEILVVIALTSILMETMLLIYQKNNRSYDIMTVKSDLYKQNLTSLDTVRKDVKKSNKVLSNYDIYSTSSNTLILQIPQLDGNLTPIDNSYYFVIYRPNPAKPSELQRIEIVNSTPTTRIINEKLSLILFSLKDNLGNAITTNFENTAQIKIDLTLTGTSRSQSFQSLLTSNETMRNK